MTFLPFTDLYNSHFQIIFTTHVYFSTFPVNMNCGCVNQWISKSKEKRKWANESCYSMNCEPFLVGFQSEEINDKGLWWNLVCRCLRRSRLMLWSLVIFRLMQTEFSILKWSMSVEVISSQILGKRFSEFPNGSRTHDLPEYPGCNALTTEL